jgi:hypothetical protein
MVNPRNASYISGFLHEVLAVFRQSQIRKIAYVAAVRLPTRNSFLFGLFHRGLFRDSLTFGTTCRAYPSRRVYIVSINRRFNLLLETIVSKISEMATREVKSGRSPRSADGGCGIIADI